MRWTLISLLILALILVPFLLFEDYFNALAAQFASGEGSTWYAAVALGGLLASDVVLPIPSSIVSAAAGVLLGFAGWQLMKAKEPKDPYRTAAVEQGPITKSVSASGTLQALVTVEVGSQISGQITKVLVDFNDQKRGRLALVRDLLDRLPDTAVEMPAIELPKLKGKPAKERYGVLKPIPPFKA